MVTVGVEHSDGIPRAAPPRPRLGTAFLVAVELVAAGCLGWSVLAGGFGSWRHLGLFALLLVVAVVGNGCATVTVGSNRGVSPDFHSVWMLPVAVLLPAPYALVAPAADRLAFGGWRFRYASRHIQLFNIAAMGTAHFAAGRVCRLLVPNNPLNGWYASHTGTFFVAVALAALCRRVINTGLMRTAAVLNNPQRTWRSMLIDRETALLFAAEGGESISATMLVALNPILIIAILPTIALLHRALAYSKLVAAARIDPKTGLLNMSAWTMQVEKQFGRCRPEDMAWAVLIADIDHFKTVNDAYGHLIGDEVLHSLAGIMVAELDADSVVGRFGGEEYIAAVRVDSTRQAYETAEQLRIRIAGEQLTVPDGHLSTTVSVGVAVHSTRAMTLQDLMRDADAALYAAKRAGRNQTHIDDPGRGGVVAPAYQYVPDAIPDNAEPLS